MKGSNEDSLLRIKSLAGTSDIVAICKDPWDHLHLLASHSATKIRIVEYVISLVLKINFFFNQLLSMVNGVSRTAYTL